MFAMLFPFILASSFAPVLTRPQPPWEKEEALLLQQLHIVSVGHQSWDLHNVACVAFYCARRKNGINARRKGGN